MSNETFSLVSRAAHEAAFRLSSFHSHGWTNYEVDEALTAAVTAADADAVFAARAAEMAAEEAAGKHMTPWGAGLRPGFSHVTSSGRLSWRVTVTEDTFGFHTVQLEVRRPVGGLRGYVVVLAAWLRIEADWRKPDALWEITSVATASDWGIGRRHVECLRDAISAVFNDNVSQEAIIAKGRDNVDVATLRQAFESPWHEDTTTEDTSADSGNDSDAFVEDGSRD